MLYFWRYCGLVLFSYHLMVLDGLQPKSLCIFVNQLNTAWRFKYFLRRFCMTYVEIDVAKDKHDCFITNSDSEVLFKSFTINNMIFLLRYLLMQNYHHQPINLGNSMEPTRIFRKELKVNTITLPFRMQAKCFSILYSKNIFFNSLSFYYKFYLHCHSTINCN